MHKINRFLDCPSCIKRRLNALKSTDGANVLCLSFLCIEMLSLQFCNDANPNTKCLSC